MTFEEAVADLERGRTVVDGIRMSISETDEGYIEFMSGVSLRDDEGSSYREAIFLTPEAAIADWHKKVMAYAKDRPGTLYYRCRPEFEFGKVAIGPLSEKQESPDRWTCFWPTGRKHIVYARFLISDKPVLDVYRNRAA